MTSSGRQGSSPDLPVAAITGAGGYLGSVLAAAFGSAGYSVRRLVRNPTPDSSDRRFDLSPLTLTDALDGVDVLVHCAYDMAVRKRTDIWQTNVFGSVALFDEAVASGVGRTIAISSMSAYAGTQQLYGRAKLDMELAALNRGMVVVRPGLVYGPGWGGMVGTLRRLAALPVLPDFGPTARQFTVSEDDFATAVVALASTERPPDRPVGVAHRDSVPFKTLLRTFATDKDGRRPNTRFVRTPPMAVYQAMRVAELLPLGLPIRADSLLGLTRPAPSVPNLEVLEDLGVAFQPFPTDPGFLSRSIASGRTTTSSGSSRPSRAPAGRGLSGSAGS